MFVIILPVAVVNVAGGGNPGFVNGFALQEHFWEEYHLF